MSLASVVQLLFGVVAVLAAGAHLWLWRERRSEPAHLWLGVAALAVATICLGRAMVYEATSLAQVELWQRIMFAASAPLIVGFLRFSFCFLGTRYPRVDLAGLGVGAVGAALAIATPWLFDGVAHVKRVAYFGQSYLEAGMSPVGLALFFAYGALFSCLLWLYATGFRNLEHYALSILAAICTWTVLAVNDMAVTLGMYSGIYLLGLGYGAFLIAFSAILIRRFVRSTVDVERWAETLQRQVDERTAELREKERQLVDGQRLATLSALAASCAHELNNPAAYVTSNLNRLAELWRTRSGARGEVEEILAESREGVERIRAIVGELVSLARRADGERSEVDLSSVVEETLPVARNEARYRVEIVTELHDVPPVVGDPRLLGQVVLHLVLNAIQAAAAGRSPRPRVGVETSFEDGSVWLVVRDNGPGIAPELRPHLFDPLTPGVTRSGRAGFGLAVTHQIVTNHRGRIDVESSAFGTTMVVELPAKAEGAAA